MHHDEMDGDIEQQLTTIISIVQVERRINTIANIDQNEGCNPPAHRHFDQRLLQSG